MTADQALTRMQRARREPPMVLVESWARPSEIDVAEGWLRWRDAAVDGDENCVEVDRKMFEQFVLLGAGSGPDWEEGVAAFARRYGPLYGLDGFSDDEVDLAGWEGAEPLDHWRAWIGVLNAVFDLTVRSEGVDAVRSVDDAEDAIRYWHEVVGALRTSRPLDRSIYTSSNASLVALRSVLDDIVAVTRTGVGVVSVRLAGVKPVRGDDDGRLELRLVRSVADVRAALALLAVTFAANEASCLGFCNRCDSPVVKQIAIRRERNTWCARCGLGGAAASKASREKARAAKS